MQTAKHKTKNLAIEFIEGLAKRENGPLLFVHPHLFVQHNPRLANGVEGYIEHIKSLPPNGTEVRVLRSFIDGDFVFTHSVGHSSTPFVSIDVFRLTKGCIVEQWSNVQRLNGPNSFGNSMTNGPTTAKDHHLTDQNKALVKRFIQDVLISCNDKLISHYINLGQYTQHSTLAQGHDMIFPDLEDMRSQKLIDVRYTKLHRVLGEGNFVLAMSEGYVNKMHCAFFDLIRIENNLLVEHWDVIEKIPQPDYCKNTNGKF